MPKISYICPVFNKIFYLERVLNAISSQVGDYDKEYIFVDDGSTDGSLNFIREKTKKWPNTTILSQENKGPAIATQNGIKRSKGDFLKLVGGDDIMAPNCTQILLEVIKKTKSVAVFSKYKLFKKFDEIKFKRGRFENLYTIKNPIEKTLVSNFSGTTPNLYDNKFVKKSGGCNTKIFVEDFSLVLKLSKYGNFSFIKNILSFGPADDEKRIMIGKKAQLLHDYNAAIYYFLKENNVCKKIKIIACIKCLGRAEKWYRRNYKKTFFSNINFLRFKYYLTKNNENDFIKKSCEVFYKKDVDIRYKIQ